MKIVIDALEKYPVFDVSKFDPLSDEKCVNVNVRTLKKWLKISKEYSKIQRELAEMADYDAMDTYDSCFVNIDFEDIK